GSGEGGRKGRGEGGGGGGGVGPRGADGDSRRGAICFVPRQRGQPREHASADPAQLACAEVGVTPWTMTSSRCHGSSLSPRSGGCGRGSAGIATAPDTSCAGTTRPCGGCCRRR